MKLTAAQGRAQTKHPMATLEDIGLFLLIAGGVGIVGWMLTGLGRALRAERERQAPERRTSLLPLIASGLALFIGLAALTDAHTARRLALAGIVVAGIVAAVRHRTPR